MIILGFSVAPMEVENLMKIKANFSCKKRATQEAPFFAQKNSLY